MICRDLVGIHDLHRDLRVDGVGEILGNGAIHGEQDLDALLLGTSQHILAVIDLLLVQQGGTHTVALGGQEGVSHTAANDEGIGLVEQVLDHVELVRHFGAAQDGDEGTHRILHSVAEELHLFGHQIAVGGLLHKRGHAHGGAVSTVSRTERIVHKQVAQGGQLLRQRLAVFGLLGTITGVLQQHYVAILHRSDGGLGVLAHHVVVSGKVHGATQLLGQTHGHGSQRILRLRLALGLAHVGAQDHLGVVVQQILDGGKRRHDAVFIGDDAVFQRHVEVAAHQDAAAGNVQIFDIFLAQIAHEQDTLSENNTC